MVKSFLQLVGCWVLAVPAFSGQTAGIHAKRLYVEPFTTKADAQKLRDDLIAELRKLPTVSVVSDESKADLILAGGGEVWVKGYRSFSPRSELKLPSNGTPIYGGFMSVELKNKEGVTLWSYLATPGPESTDVSKDLSKRITKQLSQKLTQPAEEPAQPDPPVAAFPAQSVPSRTFVALHGAGATFPYPVYSKWFVNYKIGNPGAQITYDAIGSEAGLRQLLARGVDFSASDSPEGVGDRTGPRKSVFVFSLGGGRGSSHSQFTRISRRNFTYFGSTRRNLSGKNQEME